MLDCVAELRNLIHQEVLQGIRNGLGDDTDYYLELPDTARIHRGRHTTVRDLVFQAAQRAGGVERWGMWRDRDARAYFLPDVYIEQLTVAVIALLDALIEAMEVHRTGTSTLRPNSWHFHEDIHQLLMSLSGVDAGNFPDILSPDRSA